MNQLDFRGEECPGPLVKTIRVLSKMRVGEKLMVLTTSKECVEMIKQTIEEFEIAKMEVYIRENYYEIHLEKTVD
ncbi:MAG: sulfurtransferase TusA family protein [Sulfolobales archaeon]|jgi:TusA-related sulfurtransferase